MVRPGKANSRASARNTYLGGVPDVGKNTIRRSCVICGAIFTITTGSQKACGPVCSRKLRLGTLKEGQRRSYIQRTQRPDVACEACGEMTPQARTGPQRRWCGRCRATQEDERIRRRLRGTDRPCRKCGTNVPERAGKAGITVCAACKVDPRGSRVAYERRRRLRRYGLTEEEYAGLLAAQDGRCAGCRTTEPGVKGWCVDHCHETGRVRSLLCSPCNTALGLCREDPVILRRLARLAADFKQAREVS